MDRRTLAWITVLLTLAAAPVSARDAHWPYRGRHFVVDHRGIRYFYHGGLFFRRAGVDFVVCPPPIGAIVPVLPYGYVTYNFGHRHVFYYLDGVYYQTVPSGYVVVSEDEFEKYQNDRKAAASTSAPAADEYLVNIPNGDGSYTSVTLKKTKDGFVGPQGELYKDHPSVEQLKVLYGK